jgi:chemotaxis protein methyltransferase CheR
MTCPPQAAAQPLQVERFRAMLAHRLGLRFDDAKLAWLAEVLQRRLDTGPPAGELYQALLDAHDGPAVHRYAPEARRELDALAQELTVGETYFFRHFDQFRALVEHVVPQRLAPPGPRRLRILSAGCASGDEAYSMAMLLHAWRADPSCDVAIHAVDLNPAIIERARRGQYSSWHLRETPPALLQRWFRDSGRDVVLDDTVRAAVTFEVRNLGDDDAAFWRAGAFDVVFCRNVLMYLTPQAAQAVVAHITRALVPGGHLFLGHAETLRGLSHDYELCHTHDAFYYCRRAQLHAGPEAPGHAGPGTGSARGSAAGPDCAAWPVDAALDSTGSWAEAIAQAAERIRRLTAPDGQAAAAQAPAGAAAPLEQALALFRHERFAEALGLLQALPEEAASDPDALLLHAVLLVHGGRFDAAADACRRLLERDGLNAGAHYVLALCREGAGDPAGAAEHDQAAAYLDPAFAMPRLHLGLLARRRGHGAAARQELEQALALLAGEDPSRLLLFGGGFHRDTLLALCRAELQRVNEAPPEAAAPPPPGGRPHWTGGAGSTGPLGLTGSCVPGGVRRHG